LEKKFEDLDNNNDNLLTELLEL